MSLSASHHELSLSDLIQIGAANRRTFRARVRGTSARGELYLGAGEIVHATYGSLVGADAIYAMLGDPDFAYEVESGVLASVRTIHASWQHLLLEAARRQDEGSLPRPITLPSLPTLPPAPVDAYSTVRRIAYLVIGAALAGTVMLTLWLTLGRHRAPQAAAAAPRARAAQAGAAGAHAAPAKLDPATAIDAATLTGPDDVPPAYVSGPAPRAPGADLALMPTIVLRMLVDVDGRVADARVYRSRLDLAAFEDAARAIAPELRFQPGRRAGEAVAAWVNWPVSFASATPAATATLRLKGSDTIGGALGPDLARAFVDDHAGFDVTVEALGSSTAFVGLFDGSADLGASSRPVNEKELAEARRLGVSLEEFVIGYDGIAVFVHPKNPVASLTVEQTAQLFRGEISNWKQLGGPDAQVHLLSRPSYSGTHGFFKEKVLRRGDAKGPEEFAPGTEWVESSEELVTRVAADPYAVAYVGMGWVGPGVRALPLALDADQPAIAPAAQTVRDGSYPIYRPLLIYTRGAPHGPAATFLRFVLSPAGQGLVTKHGFIASDTPADAILPADAESAAPEAPGVASVVVRLQFKAGSAKLTASGMRAITRLARQVAARGEWVRVVGHADAEGSPVSNEHMAAWRAQTVAALLRKGGVPADKIEIESAGSEKPLATNQTGEGRDRNRRVEVFVLEP